MCGYVAASDARTSFSAPYRRAANKDSTVSASIPLMITLRHILTAEATPMRSLMGVAFIPIDRRRAATVAVSAPPSNIGTFRRCGETGAITAASTKIAFDGSRIRAISRILEPSKAIFVEAAVMRSEEHTSELQSPDHLVCRLLLEKKKK